MAFDPASNEVYIVIRGDFEKVWKLSIDDATIETFTGFSESAKMEVGGDGIEVADLLGLSGVTTQEADMAE